MPYLSIVFEHEPAAIPRAEPACFGDLHLDLIVSSLIAGRDEYELAELFYQPMHDVEAVTYRHRVLEDLEQAGVRDAITEFGGRLHEMREQLALVGKLHYEQQSERWFLDAVLVYCAAVGSLAERLAALTLNSRGLQQLRAYLASYIESDGFTTLRSDAHEVERDLDSVLYTVHVKGNRIRVGRYEDEADMSEEVERTFAKFKHGAVTDHRVRFRELPEMNHVEARILELVAKLHSEIFAKLHGFCARHVGYQDQTIRRFDREVQFYLAYLDYIEPIAASGLPFSRPRVSARSKEVGASDTFDLALAHKLVSERSPVVTNDFELSGAERILVISGPNNGGKTTFARMFGQLHYLASLGLPVPARDARLFLPDRIFTHFEREEDIETLRGKFEDELFRMHDVLQRATSDSVLIMNESFGSTTLRDALVVGRQIMRHIIDLDALCVFVTFVDELASLSESTVSMMSTVVAGDPATRTYKIVRKPADGLAYAAAIAEKYGLTHEALRKRIAR